MRVTNKKGMKFDCTRLMKWAEEKLGKSKCTAIAFTWEPKYTNGHMLSKHSAGIITTI